MKKALFLVLKTSKEAFHALEALKNAGYNATVASTESLKHAFDDDPSESHFFNLRHLEQSEKLLESIFCMFVLDEDKLEDIKNIIRKETMDFRAIKGFMYSHDIHDYEGSI